ncbi:hypothetical protein lerEdw1_010642, partial [Lerista edwardsae]
PQPPHGMNGSASDVFLGPYEDTLQPPLFQKRRCLSAVEPCSPPAEDWEEPREDEGGQFLSVQMRRSGNLWGSTHTYDSFRRHSWEPGKVLDDDPDFDQLSGSLKGLASDEVDSSSEGQLRGCPGEERDPRRAPIIQSNEGMESLLSQDEEEDLEVAQEHLQRVQAYRSSPGSACKISLYSDGMSLANG